MKRRFKSVLKKAKSLSGLSSKEKEDMKSFLLSHMEANPLTSLSGNFEIAKPVSYISWVGSYFQNKMIMVPGALLLLIMVGGGVSFAASSSLPGNLLYPVKILNEKIDSALTYSPIEKAKLSTVIALNRIKEAESLRVSGRLDQKTEASLANSFENNYVTANNLLVSIEKGDKGLGAYIALEFNDELNKHQKILRSLTDLNGGSIQDDVLSNKVDDAITKLNVSMNISKQEKKQGDRADKKNKNLWRTKTSLPAYSVIDTPVGNISATSSTSSSEKNSTSTSGDISVHANALQYTEASREINSVNPNSDNKIHSNTSENKVDDNQSASVKIPSINVEIHTNSKVKTPSIGL